MPPACVWMIGKPEYVRRGIEANPYIAEGLTGRTKINEHLHWHASNRIGPKWATDYLSAPVCDWTALDRSPHI